MEKTDLVIIGAGPAGISSAISAKAMGINDIVMLDRQEAPGGILTRCCHVGFEHTGGNKLTGVEYAKALLRDLGDGADIRINQTVIELDGKGILTIAGNGCVYRLSAKAVIIATGCRERSIGSLQVYGTRPAGVFTAGSVQKMLNLSGYRIGNRAVILGSGDVGMIVAHHLAESGVEVLAVLEKQRHIGGLERNKRLYLDTHDIPLFTEHTITALHGNRRLEAVTACRVDKKGKPISNSVYRLSCDTLVSAIGLIPELELIQGFKICSIDMSGATAIPWLFVCGNAHRIHSLVNSVIAEGTSVAKLAADYLSGGNSIIS